MSTRKTPFVNGEFYHIYNRGVDKRNIFSDKSDIDRFFQSLVEFNTENPIGSLYENSFRQLGGETAKLAAVSNKKEKKLVNIVAYCFNPNHFHLILEQVTNGGISELMKRLSGGYTWYFNNKDGRSGALLQGVFKSIHIDSNEYLLHLSAYVNLNDRVHQLGGETAKLVKSSWGEYMGEEKKGFCEKDIVLGQFKSVKEYRTFAEESLAGVLEKRYGKEIPNMGEFLLE